MFTSLRKLVRLSFYRLRNLVFDSVIRLGNWFIYAYLPNWGKQREIWENFLTPSFDVNGLNNLFVEDTTFGLTFSFTCPTSTEL